MTASLVHLHGGSASHWYTWFDKAAPYFYSWGVVFATLLRVLLIGGFLVLCLRQPGGHPLKSIRFNWRTARTRDTDEHNAALGMFESSRTLALTVGSLGLAAWSVLAAFHPTGIAPRSLGLELLFTGVLLSIGGPLLFRLEGSDGSEMGLSSMVSVGYLALVFALSDILVSVFGRPWLSVVGVVIVVVMSLKEAIEVLYEIRLTWPSVSPPPAPPSSSTSPPAQVQGLAGILVVPAVESAEEGGTVETFREGLLLPDASEEAKMAWRVVFAETEVHLRENPAWPWSSP
jgi:hypothetical protein